MTKLNNNPRLTLDELKEMEGEPVYCRIDKNPDDILDLGWGIVYIRNYEHECYPDDILIVQGIRILSCWDYNNNGFSAYRCNPEEDTNIDMPIIDCVVKRGIIKQGKWAIKDKDAFNPIYVCSICNFEDITRPIGRYCPGCGARMDFSELK